MTVTGPDGDNPITDEQIGELAELPVTDAIEFGKRNVALYALNGSSAGLRAASRRRCAEIWNARHGDSK